MKVKNTMGKEGKEGGLQEVMYFYIFRFFIPRFVFTNISRGETNNGRKKKKSKCEVDMQNTAD